MNWPVIIIKPSSTINSSRSMSFRGGYSLSPCEVIPCSCKPWHMKQLGTDGAPSQRNQSLGSLSCLNKMVIFALWLYHCAVSVLHLKLQKTRWCCGCISLQKYPLTLPQGPVYDLLPVLCSSRVNHYIPQSKGWSWEPSHRTYWHREEAFKGCGNI